MYTNRIFSYSISYEYIAVASPGGERGNVPPPPKPGKIAKDREQLTAQPAIRIDTRRKFKFLLNFSKFLLKFSYKFQNFLKNFQNFLKIFQKFQ